MSDSYENIEFDVGLGAEDKPEGREEWLKMTKGQCLRAALLYFAPLDINAIQKARKKDRNLPKDQYRPIAMSALEARAKELGKTVDKLTTLDKLDLSEAKFKKFRGNYQKGLGYIISRLGLDGPEADVVWKRLGDPRTYYSTLLLVYPTNKDGDITEHEKNRLRTDWYIIPWRMGTTTYDLIWSLNKGLQENNLDISSQDIKIECKDAQYQNVTISFAGKAIWRTHDGFRNMILEKAVTYYSKLMPFKDMSTATLREKLGLGGGASSGDISASSSDNNFSDLLSQV